MNPLRPFAAPVTVDDPPSNAAGPWRATLTFAPFHDAPDADVTAHDASPLSPT